MLLHGEGSSSVKATRDKTGAKVKQADGYDLSKDLFEIHDV